MLKTVLQRALCALWKASRLLAAAGLCVGLTGCPSLPRHGENTFGMAFVYVPAGSFPMGCGESDDGCLYDEKPRHLVTIGQPFYLGQYEVTQTQWEAVMGTRPSAFKGDDLPVENVSWNDAQEFIRRLNALENTDKYRLPTEAEWEYAARAGTMTKFSFDAAHAGEYAWYWDNAGGAPHPVGQKLPNPLGLHDMHGNVWEWVQDWYGEDGYARLLALSPGNPLRGTTSLLKDEKGFSMNPSGPPEGTFRVLRGGGWSNDLRYLRSAHRHGYPPGVRRPNVGFRVALSADHAGLKAIEAAEDAAAQALPPGAADAQPGQPAPQAPQIKTPELPQIKAPDFQLPSIPKPQIEVPPIKLQLPSFH
ncbi:MAG: formylglycine-generating enzyme family protein [Azoarcus sp.]|jgi:formylglycine-generating enzyme required for sulfatase activity|nr:formylglycine-generating enzyme family protein [Azoarcus sp.]